MKKMVRWLMTAIVLMAILGSARVEVYDDGGGGGAAVTAGERTVRVVQEHEAQREAASVRDLVALYEAVAPFADIEAAAAAGYAVASGCMTSDLGSQGIHWANGDLMTRPEVIPLEPQLLMYEPGADGSLRFLGVEYLVFQQAWHDAGHVERPVLFGQTFGLNETLLDEPFYLLHVWIGQFNPSGVFADWNPLVDCSFDVAVGH